MQAKMVESQYTQMSEKEGVETQKVFEQTYSRFIVGMYSHQIQGKNSLMTHTQREKKETNFTYLIESNVST